MIYGGSYYHIYSKGFLTPLHSGRAILIQKQLLIDFLSLSVERVCETVPGKQPAEKHNSFLRTVSVLGVADVHLCLITSKNINPAPVLDFLDFGEWGRGGEILSHLILYVETFNIQALILEA